MTAHRPYVTGGSFGDLDRNTESFRVYNDGAFAGLLRNFICKFTSENIFQMRRYHYSLLLPWKFDIIANSLNAHLDRDKALQFWREGLMRQTI